VSSIKERAQAEADEAEAENPDEENPEPIEGDEEQEAEEQEAPQEPAGTPEPSTEAQVKAMNKAIEKESERHAKALQKALGDMWQDFTECPLCQLDGYAMPFPPGGLEPQQRDAILTIMGESEGAGLKQHPDLEMCEYCDGWGKLRTGSRTDHGATEACMKCNAMGYRLKDAPEEANGSNGSSAPPAWSPPSTDTWTANIDSWGRPFGHPDFGQNPALVNAA
jgi:hypothetical protein